MLKWKEFQPAYKLYFQVNLYLTFLSEKLLIFLCDSGFQTVPFIF